MRALSMFSVAGAPALALVLAACASSPPAELNDAHSVFDRIARGPAGELAPADLRDASEELARADRSFADHGASEDTRDLAYLAKRKAEFADVRAQATLAFEREGRDRAELDRMKEEQVRRASAEGSLARERLAVENRESAAAERVRVEAEQHARQVATDLGQIATVKQEGRGMVITLPGTELFDMAKHDLSRQARSRLSHVAEVLSMEDWDSKIFIGGYTDAQGGQRYNLQLSQLRADAVRAYLASLGISPRRMTAQGFGPSGAVADGHASGARPSERHVEIVVRSSDTSGRTTAAAR